MKYCLEKYLEEQGAVSQCKADTWKTMEVYLVNSDKLMITESRFVKDAILRQVVNTLPVEAGLTSNKEMAGFYTDYQALRCWAPPCSSRHYDGCSWLRLTKARCLLR